MQNLTIGQFLQLVLAKKLQIQMFQVVITQQVYKSDHYPLIHVRLVRRTHAVHQDYFGKLFV